MMTHASPPAKRTPSQLLKVYTGSRPVSQHKWYSLLKRSSLAHPFLSTSSGAYDKEIFSVILNCPIIAAISVGAPFPLHHIPPAPLLSSYPPSPPLPPLPLESNHRCRPRN